MASASWPTAMVEGGSRTVKRFGWAVSVAVIAALFGCAIYLVERFGFPHLTHFAENPLELMVRSLGLSHFLIGWLFLFTSRRLYNRRSLTRLSLFTILGCGVCLLFAGFGGLSNPILFLVFYGSFLYHEVRDEAVVYCDYEKVPSTPVLEAFSLTTAMLFLALLSIGYALVQSFLSRYTEWLTGLWLLACGMTVVWLWSARRFVHRAGGEVGRFLKEHRPLVTVYTAILVMLIVSAPLGSIGFVVLLHVGTWLVFVRSRLRSAKPVSPRHVWTWLRATPLGFAVLHLGLGLVLLILMAMRVHVWGRVGFLSEILSSRAFAYWALMHIFMSFWSSR